MRAALQSSGPASPTTGPHRAGGRHRFVQDGEVPVVVVNPRHRSPDEARGATAELERALSVERDARSAAEKSLLQAEDTIRQLRTRLAHAEIARDEIAAAPPPVAPAPMPELDAQSSALEEEPAAPPKRAKRRTAEVATDEPAPETVEQEPIEWWRPGWRERLRGAG